MFLSKCSFFLSLEKGSLSLETEIKNIQNDTLTARCCIKQVVFEEIEKLLLKT